MRENSQLINIEKIYADILDNSIVVTTDFEVFKDKLTLEDSQKIKKRAEEFLTLFDGRERSEIRAILEEVTLDDIESIENSSALLGTKIANLESINNTDTDNIAKSLSSLSQEISNINPSRHNLSTTSILSKIPFIQTPINKYLKKFKLASSIIDDILSSLNSGEQMLRSDNIVLQHDKDRYKTTAIKLQRKALIMQIVVDAIEKNIDILDSDQKEFYQDNLVLNLQKKSVVYMRY